MNMEKVLLFASFISILFALFAGSSLAVPAGSPVGGVGIVIHGSNSTQSQHCGNIDTSCGNWPNCTDTTLLRYCVNGKVVESYCYSNSIKNRTRTTSCSDTKFPINFNITDSNNNDESVDVELYDPDNSNPMGSISITGENSINSTRSTVDMFFKYDDEHLRFKIKKLNLTGIGSLTVHLTFDIINPEISNYFIVKAYKVELPTSFVFDSIKLYISYDPSEVENTSALSLFKCSNYNAEEEECSGSWNKISSVVSAENNTVSADITGFSAYALGEYENSQSTSTTTSTNNNSNTSSTPVPVYTPVPAPSNNTSSNSTQQTNQSSNSQSSALNQQDGGDGTQNSSTVQGTAGDGNAKAPSGMFTLSMDKSMLAIALVAVCAGTLSFFFLRRFGSMNMLRKESKSTRYIRSYKRRYAKVKKPSQKQEEVKLIFQ